MTIRRNDPVHFKQLKHSLRGILGADFNRLHDIVADYYTRTSESYLQVANDYLAMVNDMRREMLYFLQHRHYRFSQQSDAYEVMAGGLHYYMNGLLMSQLLWPHHFQMLILFEAYIKKLKKVQWVLDIGPGHGLYSRLLNDALKPRRLELLDISRDNLTMAGTMINSDNVIYHWASADTFETLARYDLIIMGELLEHLDDPAAMLNKAKSLLMPEGYIWLTVPTNAPAIDHIQLYRQPAEVEALVQRCGLNIIQRSVLNADNNMTQLVGLLCKKYAES